MALERFRHHTTRCVGGCATRGNHVAGATDLQIGSCASRQRQCQRPCRRSTRPMHAFHGLAILRSNHVHTETSQIENSSEEKQTCMRPTLRQRPESVKNAENKMSSTFAPWIADLIVQL